MKNRRALQSSYRLFLLQAIILLITAALVYWGDGLLVAKSLIYGGVVCILPNVYFATRLFRNSGAKAAKKIVKDFYFGEAVKLLITFVLFAIVFKFAHVKPLLFFAGFILAQLILWVAPLFFKSGNK